MTLIRFLLLALCLSNLAQAAPVGTTFTYQGELEDNGAPANGLYDFEFRLFDALLNGNPVGTVLTSNDIPVENGVFSVELDFGAFGSEARWLSISVRPGASAGSFEALAPRQSITAAPVAQFALAGNPGPQGPQGPSGVVQIASIAGIANGIPATPVGTPPWLFAGPFTTVTVSAGQRITGSGSASLSYPAVTPATVPASLCLSANSDGATLEPFHIGNVPETTVAAVPGKTVVPASGTRVMTQSGTFRVGFCVRNRASNTGMVNGDYVNAWFMVTN